MIRHSTPLEAKADASGLIAGYASVFNGEPDSYGDVIAPGCFADSLAEHRRKGTSPVMLWSHDQSQPVGTWTSIIEDGTGLAVKGQLVLKTRAGAEAYELLKAGSVNGLSIGYREIKGTNLPGGIRRLDAVDLQEISIVALPAASDARIFSVKSEVNARWLTQVLRDAGLSKGMAVGIVQNGWRGAIDEADEAEARQLKQILETLQRATARISTR